MSNHSLQKIQILCISLSLCTAATALLLSTHSLRGKEPSSPYAPPTEQHFNNTEPRLLDRMLLSIQETSFYTQRNSELYLAIAGIFAPNTPTVETWMQARIFFRNEMLIWEEVRNTPFYQVSASSVEAKWKQMMHAKESGPFSKALNHLQAQDSELRHLLEEILIIQNAKEIKSKLNAIDIWISALEKKYHSRFF